MTSATNPAGELAGAVLNGRFRLVRLLGEGGMGSVYEAEGLHGEGRRAIKLLHPEFVKEPMIVQRFYTEAQAARALQHPNISQVQDAATAEDGTPYLVMELLQGTPLADLMTPGTPIPQQQAANIVLGVLQALTTAHTARIVHRDLKPDNLFLVRDARGNTIVKVLDFGIAKVMDAAGGMGQKTRTGVLLGTPGYMSPEQIKSSKGVDPRSDLWSLGVIFYEMLTGRLPFEADNEFARLTAVLTEPVKPIEHVAPHLAAWAPFFQRALAKEPSERFQSADEMARALTAMMQPWTGQPAHDAAGAPAASYVGPAQQHAGVPMQPVPSGPSPYSHVTLGGAGLSPQGAQAMGAQGTVALSLSDMPPALHASPQASPAAHTPPAMQAPPQMQAPPAMLGSTARSAPVVPIVTAVSVQRPPGIPTLRGGTPSIEVVEAPPMRQGAAWWIVGVVAFVCLGLGFAAGWLAAGVR